MSILHHIYKNILNYEHQHIGLMNGACSELIFLHHYFSAYPELYDQAAEQKIAGYRDLIFNDIENERIDLSYASGLAGVLSCSYYLENSQWCALDFLDFEDIGNVMLEQAIEEFENDNFDFFYGGNGLLMPFLNNRLDIRELDKDLLHILKETIVRKKTDLFWQSPKNKEDNISNFGISHGFLPNLFLLACIADSDKDISFIKKTASEFLAYASEENTESVFPSVIEGSKENSKYASRLAWCYGDLGIACILYKIGKLIKDKSLQDKALEILLKTTLRKHDDSSKVTDASVCHGSAGISSIYHSFYDQTGNILFKEAGDYWQEITKSYYSPKDQQCCFLYKSADEYVYNIGLLEGLSGIGLSLLPNKEWSSLFLIR
ncbi:lanthionine synthetase LanC family protein [Chryseobacterium sp. BIGb0232]|uniref:lanthionine synthetase LanC family protein n=1 Tax=Chryseobacterium sp. BIGb0232 TaxID=2940598 RepID=UPI000F4AC510|nr:lanthionine synthetase LanC family protein [Chryseobacterium sp. BIGb0232]MCS4302297.1 lantibiotic modifying enzyme [Chryseobacterium sp. BIGb0232]ROS18242.1 lanthionine synthetase-like protein [Chryseobacterium nakagawai]